jgi:hypothetical protein
MRPKCAQAIQAAAGRKMSKAELDGIEERMKVSLRDLASKDPAKFNAMSIPERLSEATKMAKERMLHGVVEAHERSILEADRKAKLRVELNNVTAGVNGQVKALQLKLEELEVKKVPSVMGDFLRMLTGLNEADGGKFFGFFQDQAKQLDLMKALRGEPADPALVSAVKPLKDMLDALAKRFKAAGLPLHILDDWHTPQPMDPMLVGKNLKAWIKDMLGWVDRTKYVNADGTRMTDSRLTNLLEFAGHTIATDGANKRMEGEGGGGSPLVGYGQNMPRQLHFKDAASWHAAMQKYGRTSNMYQLVGAHVRGMARDIAHAEMFGRNMEDNFSQALDRAYVNDQAALTKPGHFDDLASLRTNVERIYKAYVHPERPGNEKWANRARNARFILGSTQLGSLVGALPDLAAMKLAQEYLGLPFMRTFHNFARGVAAGEEGKRFLGKLGVYFEGFQHMAHRMDEEGIRNGWGQWLNEMTHRMMGLQAGDRGMRSGIGRTVMDTIGRFTRTHDTLAAADGEARLLQRHGITEDHWATWKLAELDKGPDGDEALLTPENIHAIPDEKLDPLVEQRVAKRSKVLQEEIDKRNQRNAEEAGWIQKRIDRLAQVRDRANKVLRELVEGRQAKIDKSTDLNEAKAGLLKARIEQLEIEHDIAGYLKTQTAQDKISAFLRKVEDGAQIERKTVIERVHPDRLPDATIETWAKDKGIQAKAEGTVERYGYSINQAAERLGQRRARAEATIKEMERRISERQKGLDAETLRRARELDKRFQPRVDELRAFTEEMQQRAAKRLDYADAFQGRLGKVLEEERDRMKFEAAEKILEAAYGEMQYGARGASASTTRERVAMGMDTAVAGTLWGEFTRFFMQFKSVPMGVFMTHWTQAKQLEGWGAKTSYLARFVAYSALMGAVAVEAKAVMNGQDPMNMNPMTKEGRSAWVKALVAGGGFGIYGDLFLHGETAFGSGPLQVLAGPGVGAASDFIDQLWTASKELNEGTSKHSYALAGLRWVRHNALPFMNIWYTKAAFNRLVYDQLQDKLSPGASFKQELRMRQRGANYWWRPGTTAPQRGPELGRMWSAGP